MNLTPSSILLSISIAGNYLIVYICRHMADVILIILYRKYYWFNGQKLLIPWFITENNLQYFGFQ